MIRRNPTSLSCNTGCRALFLSWRSKEFAFTQHLTRAVRVAGPTLVALSFAGVAHAQGTIDFSGAQTLMGSFNERTSAIQSEIVLADLFRLIAEKPVCTIDGQREDVRKLQHSMKRRMFFGAEQV
jgi:hypothetical protein